jgi:hypothetical protein
MLVWPISSPKMTRMFGRRRGRGGRGGRGFLGLRERAGSQCRRHQRRCAQQDIPATDGPVTDAIGRHSDPAFVFFLAAHLTLHSLQEN